MKIRIIKESKQELEEGAEQAGAAIGKGIDRLVAPIVQTGQAAILHAAFALASRLDSKNKAALILKLGVRRQGPGHVEPGPDTGPPGQEDYTGAYGE